MSFCKVSTLRKTSFVVALVLGASVGKRIAVSQEPSKAVRLFGKANAGAIELLCPTVMEIDKDSVLFLVRARKTRIDQPYSEYAEIPFAIIFRRGETQGIGGEGKVKPHQEATMIFSGNLRVGEDHFNFEYMIGQALLGPRDERSGDSISNCRKGGLS